MQNTTMRMPGFTADAAFHNREFYAASSLQEVRSRAAIPQMKKNTGGMEKPAQGGRGCGFGLGIAIIGFMTGDPILGVAGLGAMVAWC